MRENAGVKVCGTKADLIPYLKEHVETYHKWMSDPFLQGKWFIDQGMSNQEKEMTASEPLSTEEEYAMQEDWANDPQKCTFIIFDREGLQNIVGDVNLFLNDDEDKKKAEIEIMIAEASARRKVSVLLMMKYGAEELGLERFQAKISMKNMSSICLFRDKLHYKEVSRSSVFEEITFEVEITDGYPLFNTVEYSKHSFVK